MEELIVFTWQGFVPGKVQIPIEKNPKILKTLFFSILSKAFLFHVIPIVPVAQKSNRGKICWKI